MCLNVMTRVFKEVWQDFAEETPVTGRSAWPSFVSLKAGFSIHASVPPDVNPLQLRDTEFVAVEFKLQFT
jgi:hypothetical protein